MEPGNRENIWRISVVAIAVVAVVISALAYYGIKRLERESIPHVHDIREVKKYRVETKPDPNAPQPPAK